MRRDTDQGTIFTCDICGLQEVGRVVEARPNQHQWIQPAGWFALDARHDHGENRPRLKAHVCGTACGAEQLRAWARHPSNDPDLGEAI